jgi:D-glycero-D-manno-heptose 1,7-bisphosphate phosphatase
MNKRPAVFIDRDGVINYIIDRGDNFFVAGRKVRYTAPHSYAEFKLKPGIGRALKFLSKIGFLRILVTNQPDSKYGLISQEDYERIMKEIFSLGFDDIFVCLHARNEGCKCRKPKPGMFLEARDKWNIDFSSSYIVGDTGIDVRVGKAIGLKTILISADYNRRIKSDFRVGSFLEAALLILIIKKIERGKEK